MNELGILITTAIFIGTVHTLIGVDHYIPFVAMSKANNWHLKKTLTVVLICGLGHVLSSVLLGLIGILIGSRLSVLVDIESVRGDIATYFLMGFGLIYMVWGIRNAVKNKPHRHTLSDGSVVEHSHIHSSDEHKTSSTFWALFILFVLGPCEPLIPILMYPAASSSILSLLLVTGCFALCTIGTMLIATVVVLKGIDLLPLKKLERYSHVMAGFSIVMCGFAIKLFGI